MADDIIKVIGKIVYIILWGFLIFAAIVFIIQLIFSICEGFNNYRISFCEEMCDQCVTSINTDIHCLRDDNNDGILERYDIFCDISILGNENTKCYLVENG